LPQGGQGPKRVDDRRVLNGILIFYVRVRRGVIGQNAMALTPPFTTVIPVGYGMAFGRQSLMPLLIKTRIVCFFIDSSIVKAHRAAMGAQEGNGCRLWIN